MKDSLLIKSLYRQVRLKWAPKQTPVPMKTGMYKSNRDISEGYEKSQSLRDI